LKELFLAMGENMNNRFIVPHGGRGLKLAEWDPEDTGGITKENVAEEYGKLHNEFYALQELFYASKQYGLLIILQGMDCSGKDGTVKNTLAGVNPNGFYVENFKTPSPEESGHDYLWRIHKKIPKKGDITVFNRSYYEDVLITRVHNMIDDDTAFGRFGEIREFEKYLFRNNIVILKFFLHISKEFQRKKLENRLKNPEKNWKFSETDLKERAFWDEYQKCYEDALANCSIKEAPWHIIPADRRWFRDHIILKTIVGRMRELKLEYPKIAGNLQELIREVTIEN